MFPPHHHRYICGRQDFTSALERRESRSATIPSDIITAVSVAGRALLGTRESFFFFLELHESNVLTGRTSVKLRGGAAG